MKWKRSQIWFAHCGIGPVIGTIPSIPIPTPFSNFGIELTPNSNSSLGIGATTPTPIQRNWGDSKGFQCLFWNQLKKLKKHVNQVSLAVFLNYQWHLDGEREIQTCGIPWNPPNSMELELESTPQFHLWSWNWGIPKINSKESELECGIVNWPKFFSNDWIDPTEINYSMGANPFGVCVERGLRSTMWGVTSIMILLLMLVFGNHDSN